MHCPFIMRKSATHTVDATQLRSPSPQWGPTEAACACENIRGKRARHSAIRRSGSAQLAAEQNF